MLDVLLWLWPHLTQYLVHWWSNGTATFEIYLNAHQRIPIHFFYTDWSNSFSQLVSTRLLLWHEWRNIFVTSGKSRCLTGQPRWVPRGPFKNLRYKRNRTDCITYCNTIFLELQRYVKIVGDHSKYWAATGFDPKTVPLSNNHLLGCALVMGSRKSFVLAGLRFVGHS